MERSSNGRSEICKEYIKDIQYWSTDLSIDSFNYLFIHILSQATLSPTEFPHSISMTSPVMKWFLPVLGWNGRTPAQTLSLYHFLHTLWWKQLMLKTGNYFLYLHWSCLQSPFCILQLVQTDFTLSFLRVVPSSQGFYSWGLGINTGSLGNLRFWDWDAIGKKQYSVVIFCWRKFGFPEGTNLFLHCSH